MRRDRIAIQYGTSGTLIGSNEMFFASLTTDASGAAIGRLMRIMYCVVPKPHAVRRSATIRAWVPPCVPGAIRGFTITWMLPDSSG
jgi:hypothetical protein